MADDLAPDVATTDAAPATEAPESLGPTGRPEDAIRAELRRQLEASTSGESASPDDEPSRQASAVLPPADADSSGDAGASATQTPSKPPSDGGAPIVGEAAGDAPDPDGFMDQWSPDQRAVFEGLADDHRGVMEDYVRQIQRGAHDKFQEAAKIRQQYEGLDQALAPIQADIEETGVAPAAAIAQTVALYRALSTDPLGTLEGILTRPAVAGSLRGKEEAGQTLARIAQALGVDLGTIADQAWQSGDDDGLKREIADLRKEVQTQRADRQRDTQAAAQQRAVAGASEKLREFQDAKDTGGKLLHPHLGNQAVQDTMTGLIRAGMVKADDIEGAYTKAVRMEGLATGPVTNGAGNGRERRTTSTSPRTRSGAATAQTADPALKIKHENPRVQSDLRIRDELRRQINAGTA